MHELTCPACSSPSQFNLRDHLLMCPYCSATFGVDFETGRKELYGEHYIIPNEHIAICWDGFPLDSTFSRGRLEEEKDTRGKTAYERREFFEFKFANGLPILGIQVTEEEALRRARNHVEQYHFHMAELHCD